MKPKIYKGEKREKLCKMIVISTASSFSIMVNPDNRGPNFKFTPKNISNMSLDGLVAGGYKGTDLVLEYPDFDETITLKDFWLKESEIFAESLIKHSGLV